MSICIDTYLYFIIHFRYLNDLFIFMHMEFFIKQVICRKNTSSSFSSYNGSNNILMKIFAVLDFTGDSNIIFGKLVSLLISYKKNCCIFQKSLIDILILDNFVSTQ